MNRYQIINKLKKDVESHVNHKLSIILKEGLFNSEEIINKLDVSDLEQELANKYIPTVQHYGEQYLLENEMFYSISLNDLEDYNILSISLINNKNASTQLRSLERLLTAYIIDTKQKNWIMLAKSLQQCLISLNDEIFQKALKLHYKLISIPTSSSEGYLNLIQTLIMIFNNKVLKPSKEIDENNKIHKRVEIIFKLLLKTQDILLKHWLHAKQKSIQEVIITFIYLLNYSQGNELYIGALDFLAVTDSQANWFKKFCYSVQTRTIILNCFKKTCSLRNYFINSLMNYLKNSNQGSFRNFQNFSHSAYFLLHFLSFKQNFYIFPIDVLHFQESISFENFALMLILKINNETENCIRNILITLLKQLLINNCRIILSPSIQRNLFEPLLFKNSSKEYVYLIIEENRHILDVINGIVRLHSNKGILSDLLETRNSATRFRQNSLSMHTEKLNIFQIIVTATGTCLRIFINNSEFQRYVNNVIFELMDCCINMLSANFQIYYKINLSKLIITLRDFYNTVTNHSINSIYYTSRISRYICYFIESSSDALKIIESENGLLYEIVCNNLINVNSLESENNFYSKLILCMANCKEGSKIIEFNHDALIKQHLLNIWRVGSASQENSSADLQIKNLLHFLDIINYNSKAIQALLHYENEDTIVENKAQSLVFEDILLNALDITYTNMTDILLGLQIIRVLIHNLDTFLYLQYNYNLQEKLIELQVNSQLPCSVENNEDATTSILIDECSSLRHYILLLIKFYGRVDNEYNNSQMELDYLPTISYLSSNISDRNNFKKNYSNSVGGQYAKIVGPLSKFLHETKSGLHDYNWLLQARRAFKNNCKCNHKKSTIIDLLQQIPKKIQHNLMWPITNVSLFKVLPEERYGIDYIVKFGIENGILQSSSQNRENLTLFLKQTRTFLDWEVEEYVGFDWFSGIMFLMCGGNLEKLKTTILNFSKIASCTIVWFAMSKISSRTQAISDQFYNQLELIVNDMSSLHSALKIIGISAKHMAEKWIKHCFFTLLSYDEICNYFELAALYPTEYTLYFIISIFEHIKEQLYSSTYLDHVLSSTIVARLLEFRLTNYLNFIDKLSKQYKNVLH